MKLQTNATQVALRTSLLMRAGQKATANSRKPAVAALAEPSWFRVVIANPPTHQLLPRLRRLKNYVEADRKVPETAPNGMYVTRNKKKFSTQGGHIYKLEKIKFPEDKIRRTFYTNHPWELASPRNVVESNGKSLAGRDWSHINQPGLKLSGENVVQRTMWLASQPDYVKKHGKDWYEAYTQARLEFYRLRMREHAEREVAAEEAVMSGAVFGETAIEHGLATEQKIIDKYVVEAEDESKKRAARMAKSEDD